MPAGRQADRRPPLLASPIWRERDDGEGVGVRAADEQEHQPWDGHGELGRGRRLPAAARGLPVPGRKPQRPRRRRRRRGGAAVGRHRAPPDLQPRAHRHPLLLHRGRRRRRQQQRAPPRVAPPAAAAVQGGGRAEARRRRAPGVHRARLPCRRGG